MKKQYEIQVMVREDDKAPYMLLDRCHLEADTPADAARAYADLFISMTPVLPGEGEKS